MMHIGTCRFQRAHDTTFEHFRLLEVNRAFYEPPMNRTVRTRRDEESPDDFVFNVEAWQPITHEPSSPTYRKADMDIPDDARNRCGFFSADGGSLRRVGEDA